jgi:glycopeptide antibiotics resistance protein
MQNLTIPHTNTTARLFVWALLLTCLLILSKYILFKKSPRYYKNYFKREYRQYKVKEGWARANLAPFSTIRLFSSRRVSAEYSYKNIGGNIIGFVPLGILLPLLFGVFRNFFLLTGAVFFTSLSFETVQLLLGTGVFDVDDLILNTAGGIGGYLLFIMVGLLIPQRKH